MTEKNYELLSEKFDTEFKNMLHGFYMCVKTEDSDEFLEELQKRITEVYEQAFPRSVWTGGWRK